MSGDNIDIYAKSFYKGQSGYNSSNSVLTDLLGQFINALNNNNLNNKGATATNIENNINTGANDYFNNNMAAGSGTDPKAGICWILFDEQLNYVTANYDRVSTTTGTNVVLKNHSFNVPIVKSGYLYIYCSNESNVPVYFDNILLIHNRGPLVEETILAFSIRRRSIRKCNPGRSAGNYAFGLTMAGISSKAASFGGAENKNKYQNYEYNNDFDINLYESFYRNHDPQIGRFWQIDPKPNDVISLYVSMENNPIRFNDPLGDSILPNVSYNFTRTATPTKYNDLGNTTDTYIGITSATFTNVNITVDISISLSAAFIGPTRATNIETQNPGLQREVTAHEEGHKDQIMEAANKSIKISVKIDGKKREFSGTADKVIAYATAVFNNSTKAEGMSTEEKQNFVNTKIVVPALNKMSKNIDKALKNSDKLENDANNRAAEKLGANTIIYNNGSPIIFNGVRIQ